MRKRSEQKHLLAERTSRELRQILHDAENFIEEPNFIGEPRNSKRERKQPDRYQELVAQDGEPTSFKEAA